MEAVPFPIALGLAGACSLLTWAITKTSGKAAVATERTGRNSAERRAAAAERRNALDLRPVPAELDLDDFDDPRGASGYRRLADALGLVCPPDASTLDRVAAQNAEAAIIDLRDPKGGAS
jgi:hypothetical protein